jgi:hypothetical protein
MVYFQTKNHIRLSFGESCYGRFGYIFMAICYILRPFGILFSDLVYFSRFGILYQEKSCNPTPIRV